MPHHPDKYANYVDHPRYGRRPNVTGLNPRQWERGAHLHWHNGQAAIPNTAIAADISKQQGATVPVTHYFDLDRVCRDCGQRFIFFALEQQHWYEQLGFSLNSDCVRCSDCRRRQRGIVRQREVYESLYHVPDKTTAQHLDMAEACLALIESGTFTIKQLPHVRALLNAIPEEDRDERSAKLLGRVEALEPST